MVYDINKKTRLKDLKALAEETYDDISALDARTSVLAYNSGNNAALHNSIYRGKNLGEFTAEHLAAIRNGTYNDMWIGDYFVHNGKKDIIANFGSLWADSPTSKSILLYRATALQTCDDYVATYNRTASGTEGEDDYIASTDDHCYPTSNWYVNVRPKFIEEIEQTYSIANIPAIRYIVPTAMNGTTATAWSGMLDSKAHLPTLMMVGFPQVNFTGTGGGWVSWYPRLPLHILKPSDFTESAACAEILFGVRYGGANVVKTGPGSYFFSNDVTFGGGNYGHCLCPIFQIA